MICSDADLLKQLKKYGLYPQLHPTLCRKLWDFWQGLFQEEKESKTHLAHKLFPIGSTFMVYGSWLAQLQPSSHTAAEEHLVGPEFHLPKILHHGRQQLPGLKIHRISLSSYKCGWNLKAWSLQKSPLQMLRWLSYKNDKLMGLRPRHVPLSPSFGFVTLILKDMGISAATTWCSR